SVLENDSTSLTLGAAAHLTKPVSKQVLLTTLHRYLGPSPGSKSILAVDDEPEARQLIESFLKEAGYSVITAEGGAQALQILSSQPVQAVVLDLCMPEMSGFELLFRIKERDDTARLPVIVLTALELTREDIDLLRKATKAILSKGGAWKQHIIDELR